MSYFPGTVLTTVLSFGNFELHRGKKKHGGRKKEVTLERKLKLEIPMFFFCSILSKYLYNDISNNLHSVCMLRRSFVPKGHVTDIEAVRRIIS
jgi:hypothetical protein